MNRRALLAATGGTVLTGIAGCAGLPELPDAQSAAATAGRLAITDFSPSADMISKGALLSVEGTVENTGETRVTEAVDYRIGSTVLDSSDVSVGPGEQAKISFTEIDTRDIFVGKLIHGIFTEHDAATEQLLVEADNNDAFFEASSLEPTEIFNAVDAIIGPRATITNLASTPGTQTVTYEIGGYLLDEQDVTLDRFESREIRFGIVEIPASLRWNGTIVHRVTTADHSHSVEIDIEESVAGWDVSVSDFEPATATIGQGESMTVSASVHNADEAFALVPVGYYIAEQPVGAEEIPLGPGESVRISFEDVTVGDLAPGRYDHGITVPMDNAAGELVVE